MNLARPLRQEAAGAVYHTMAWGEGGRGVFEDEVDRRVWLVEKSLVAALIRKRTGVHSACVAERLGLRHEVNVTVALRRVRESGYFTRQLARLERKLGKNG